MDRLDELRRDRNGYLAQIQHVAQKLGSLSDAFHATGNDTVSDKLSSMVRDLAFAHKRLSEIESERIHIEYEEARASTARIFTAILDRVES